MWDEITVVYCRRGHRVGWLGEHLWQSLTPGRLARHMAQSDFEEVTRLHYCTTCGAESIFICESCEAIIGNPGQRPAYCGTCGKPYPWTTEALAAAKEYTDELDTISTEEKESLKTTFDDLTVESPRTPLAVSRFKRIMEQIGPVAGPVLSKIVVQFADDATKKLLGM